MVTRTTEVATGKERSEQVPWMWAGRLLGLRVRKGQKKTVQPQWLRPEYTG